VPLASSRRGIDCVGSACHPWHSSTTTNAALRNSSARSLSGSGCCIHNATDLLLVDGQTIAAVQVPPPYVVLGSEIGNVAGRQHHWPQASGCDEHLPQHIHVFLGLLAFR
jgi:hypothetical protein